MITGKKIQRQSINLMIPAKSTKIQEIKNEQPPIMLKINDELIQRIEDAKKQQSFPQRIGESFQRTINKKDSAKQVLKQTSNNNKQPKGRNTKSKQRTNKSTQKASKSSYVNTERPKLQKQLKKQMQKANVDDKRKTKQKIQQILKQQEVIRKAFSKPMPSQSKNKQQITEKSQKSAYNYPSTSGLNQQKQIQFSEQDEPQEQQRQVLPNPIQQISFQQQQLDLNVQSNTRLIEYEDSSFEQQAFSFLPQKQSPQKHFTTDLPINMDLFELTADQLLALDYIPI